MTKSVLVFEKYPCPHCGSILDRWVEFRVARNAKIQPGRTVKIHRKGCEMRDVLVLSVEHSGREIRLVVSSFQIAPNLNATVGG